MTGESNRSDPQAQQTALPAELLGKLWAQVVERLDSGEALVSSELIRNAVEEEYRRLAGQKIAADLKRYIFRMVEKVNGKHPETYLLRGIQNAVNRAFVQIVRQHGWDEARIQIEGTPFIRQFTQQDHIRDLFREANLLPGQIDSIQCVRNAVDKASRLRGTVPGEECVLVVDDSAMMRMAVCAIVKQLGYHVREAVDGLDALSQARAQRPNLIILDLNIPKMGGLDTLKAFRKEENLKSIPVIVLTSVKEPEAIREAAASQVEDYMVKPLPPHELKKRIRKYLG